MMLRGLKGETLDIDLVFDKESDRKLFIETLEGMKFRKEIRKLCPFCKKHTIHKVKQEKNRGKNKTRTMSKGSRVRMRLRGADRGHGNHGKTSKGAITRWKRWNKKRTKKTDLRFTCNECRKTSLQGHHGIRVGKIVFE